MPSGAQLGPHDGLHAAVEATRHAHADGATLGPGALADHLQRQRNLGRPKPARAASGIDLLEQTIAHLQAAGQPVPADLLRWRDDEAAAVATREAGRKRAPGAGRPATRTQYDESDDRWAQVRAELPAQLWAELVAPIARDLQRQGVPAKGRGGMPAQISSRLSQLAAERALQGLPFVRPPHVTTIKRILKSRGF